MLKASDLQRDITSTGEEIETPIQILGSEMERLIVLEIETHNTRITLLLVERD